MKTKYDICPCCGRETELKEVRIFCKKYDNNSDKNYIHYDCSLFLCDECAVRCEDCNEIILTPKLKQFLINHSDNCSMGDKCCILTCECEEIGEKYLVESRKLQKSVITVFAILISLVALAIFPGMIVAYGLAFIFWISVRFCKFIGKRLDKFINTKNKISLIPQPIIKYSIMAFGYLVIAFDYFKKNWFKCSVILLLLLILFKLF